jgi:hypothetical protein
MRLRKKAGILVQCLVNSRSGANPGCGSALARHAPTCWHEGRPPRLGKFLRPAQPRLTDRDRPCADTEPVARKEARTAKRTKDGPARTARDRPSPAMPRRSRMIAGASFWPECLGQRGSDASGFPRLGLPGISLCFCTSYDGCPVRRDAHRSVCRVDKPGMNGKLLGFRYRYNPAYILAGSAAMPLQGVRR